MPENSDDNSLLMLAQDLTMNLPRRRPNVWVCVQHKCPFPCWATSEDPEEIPQPEDCMDRLRRLRGEYCFVQIKPMTGRIARKGTGRTIDVEAEHEALQLPALKE